MERTKLLILRITNRCNLACRYCYAAHSESRFGRSESEDITCTDMSLETACRAIDLLVKPGDKLKLQFTGGEPLLCTELMQDIFKYVKQRGIQTLFSVQTNGTLISKEVCNQLKSMHCAVGVSLDGMGEANRLRIYPNGKESFEDVIDGIHTLGQAGIACNVNAVVSSESQKGLDMLLELAAYLQNVKGIGLDMFRPIGRGESEDFSPNMEMLQQNLIAMLEKQKQLRHLGVIVKIKELEKVRIMLKEQIQETCYCYAQTGDSIAVDPSGDIYPCSSFVGMKKMRMGNVWENNEWTRPNVPGMDSVCQICEMKMLCRGGCPAGRTACGGRNETDCMMHRTMIEYGRKEYA